MNNKMWTNEEIDRLIQLNKDGKCIIEIAEIMNETETRIRFKLNHLEIKPNYIRKGGNKFIIAEVIKLKESNIKNSKITAMLNISHTTLYKIIRKFNLSLEKKYWTKEEDNYLISHYKNTSTKELSKKLNRTVSCIRSRAAGTLSLKKTKDFIQENIKHTRKYNVCFDYFNKIDTQEKAYWYGFIWADGNVSNTHLNISVHEKDIEVLEKFKKSINSEAPIKIVKDKRMSGNMVKITISSYKIVNDLYKINIKERKTYLDNLPVLSDDLFWAFLAGFFDGDGCFSNRNKLKNSGCFAICCRQIMGDWIKQRLTSVGINGIAIYNIKDKENKNLIINRIRSLINLYEKIYSEDIRGLCLQRKFRKFKEFYDLNKNKIPHHSCKT